MQELDHDMDDLFRKSADEYPVKAGDSRWDDLSVRLRGDTDLPLARPKKNSLKKSEGVLVLGLLFLFAGGILVKFSAQKNHNNGFGKSPKVFAADNRVEPAIGLKKDVTGIDQSQIFKNKTHLSIHDVVQKKKIQPVTTISAPEENQLPHSASRGLEDGEMLGETGKRTTISLQHSLMPIADISNHASLINQAEQNKKIGQVESINHPQISGLHKLSTRRGIYFGLVFGPSFSQVKYMQTGKSGFDIGIISGYQVNKRISLESGLLIARKYYSSAGKYFSMDKVGSSMPTGMEILSLDGAGTFFEIPLLIKYDIFKRENSTIFSSAGISSRIMIGEKNVYRTSMNGVQQYLVGSYNHARGYFAASFDIGLGYEKKIAKIGDIRIGPYMQIPLKGIGVGALPVISTGLHLAFTRFAR